MGLKGALLELILETDVPIVLVKQKDTQPCSNPRGLSGGQTSKPLKTKGSGSASGWVA